MIKSLFLKTDKTLSDIANEIFKLFDIKEIYEGESSFYINFKYYCGCINEKIKIKISLNNYDFEDLFNIYISLKIDEDNDMFGENFCKKLSGNLKLIVSMENCDIKDSLIYFYPGDN